MSSFLGNFAAILIGVCVIYVVTAKCPPEWKSWRESCYILLEEKLNWSEATRVCGRPESSLVVPSTQEENDMIHQWQHECVDTTGCGLWVGCNRTEDLALKCRYKTQSKYSPGPIITPSGDIGCLFMSLANGGNWQVAGFCSEEKNVICEMPPQVHVYSLTMASDGRVKPQCLRDHDIKSVAVKGVIECGAACWAEPLCRSFNLWQGGPPKICQLNNATVLESEEGDVIFDDECNYFEL